MSYTAGTFVTKSESIKRDWILIDATNKVLGRLASRIAILLRGKHKCYFYPSMNCGDHVVVINANKIKISGKKLEQKKFYWHTGYPGGIKEITWGKILEGQFPERLLMKAVERMLPKESPLARQQLKSLYVYQDENHKHTAQQPKLINLS